eukprot:GEMP01036343.1.p1 GENE.GEMP01036343.1~~GEMP01036343.1.p1  ORF type:complete len:321 (-),score=88.59 GEMP01036343.1:1059-1997(-)
MPFVKVVKNKAYCKRLQTRYRRRREGKTDYEQRRILVKQDKNKYNTPKYRLVVRFTLTKVITQIIYSTIEGDRTFAQALSTELPRYGVSVGLTNYAASYATGLLCARRCLEKLGLDKTFVGIDECDGEEYHIDEEDTERRPFKCVLDVGLKRTTVGSRIWGSLKGAVDGGLHIPHSIKRFPGYKAPEEKGAEHEYDAEAHKDRILGDHVSTYMAELKEEDKERYERQFARYVKAGIESDDLEDMYIKCHAAIRANPKASAKKPEGPKNTINGNKVTTPSGKTYTRKVKKSLAQRRDTVRQKMKAAARRAAAA